MCENQNWRGRSPTHLWMGAYITFHFLLMYFAMELRLFCVAGLAY